LQVAAKSGFYPAPMAAMLTCKPVARRTRAPKNPTSAGRSTSLVRVIAGLARPLVWSGLGALDDIYRSTWHNLQLTLANNLIAWLQITLHGRQVRFFIR